MQCIPSIFASRLQTKLGFDVQAAKTGGYYHRIGLLKGENTYENIKAVYEEHAFPKNACLVLQEYADTSMPLASREAAVVYLSDKIISAIMSLFESGQEKIEYGKLIDAVFETSMKKGLLDKSSLTMADLVQMKEIFKREQLYYDFLR